MSADEGFLTRWSRRKEAARRREALPPAEVPEPPPAPDAASVEQSSPAPEEAPVPLEELPPIESIGPETDLRPWLKRNVPQSWRQAALRRLWVSDPAIRDFVGLADYDWDWNTPGGMPGYGPLEAGEAVRRRLLAAVEWVPPPSDEEPGGAVRAAACEPAAPPASEVTAGHADVPKAVRLPGEEPLVPATTAEADGAHADVKAASDGHRLIPRRRSGSATPV